MVLLRQRLASYKMGFTVPLILLIILLTACDKPPVVTNLPPDTIGYPKTIITALGKQKLTNSRNGLWPWEVVEDILLALDRAYSD